MIGANYPYDTGAISVEDRTSISIRQYITAG